MISTYLGTNPILSSLLKVAPLLKVSTRYLMPWLFSDPDDGQLLERPLHPASTSQAVKLWVGAVGLAVVDQEEGRSLRLSSLGAVVVVHIPGGPNYS